MLPKLISIGDFFLPAYGVLVAIGFLAGLWLSGRLARRQGLDPDKVTNLAVYGALAGLGGAKLLMFLLDYEYYAKYPREIFSFSTLQAGGVFYGGLVIALLFGYWYAQRSGLPITTTLDVLAPGLALAQGIGRIGCFAAGCCWGTQCDRPWAVTFTNPDAHELTGVPLQVALHPSQLYEAVLLAGVFAVVYGRSRKQHAPGSILGLYLILSAAARFGAEFFRAHQQPNLFDGPLSNAQWISILLFAAGVWLVWTRSPSLRSRAGRITT
jgi:phosphatidylglycerol:prolipoprotein diacylglycerol transferase